MKTIDLTYGFLKVFNDNIAVVEINEGIQIDKEKVMGVIEAAENYIAGDYALISNRKQAYSTEIIKLYQVLSSRPRLKYTAIVAHRGITLAMYEQEKSIKDVVSQKKLPLELFVEFDDALIQAGHYLKKQNQAEPGTP